MSNLFLDSSLNEDISGWDTSSVTTMSNMFRNAIKFDQDISSWNISVVNDFSNMFSGTSGLSNNNKVRIYNSFSRNSDWLQYYNDWSNYELEPEPEPQPEQEPEPQQQPETEP